MKRLKDFLRPLLRNREQTWTFSIVTGVLYLGYLVWAHAHHEFWRDEIHSWTVARTADGFGDILTGDRIYEGHPPLWHWYLRLWTWLTDRAWGLHAANVFAIAVAAVLFLRFAPFARILKVLLLCSYLLGFEYGVMSRNYTLDWLLLVLFCVAYRRLPPRLLPMSAFLALLSMASAYGAVLSCCLFLVVLGSAASLKLVPAMPKRLELTATPRIIVPALLVLGSLVASYTTASPPDPNPFSPGWNFAALDYESIGPALGRLMHAFFPVRIPSDINSWAAAAFWGEHRVLRTAGGIVLLVVAFASLIPAWPAAFAFVFGTALMAVLQTARYGGSMRHWGHAFILYVAACWIARKSKPNAGRHLSSFLLVLASAFQIESWVVVLDVDRVNLFSGGEQTAQFIERSGLQDLPIVAGPDWFVITVMGYLRRNYVSVETQEINQTAVFHARRRPFSAAALVNRAISLSREKKGPVLVVANMQLPRPPERGIAMPLRFVSKLPNMVDGERFYVYEVNP